MRVWLLVAKGGLFLDTEVEGVYATEELARKAWQEWTAKRLAGSRVHGQAWIQEREIRG